MKTTARMKLVCLAALLMSGVCQEEEASDDKGESKDKGKGSGSSYPCCDECTKPYSAGEISSVEKFTYGRFEANIMVGTETEGTISAFFLYKDLYEVGHMDLTAPWQEIDYEIHGKGHYTQDPIQTTIITGNVTHRQLAEKYYAAPGVLYDSDSQSAFIKKQFHIFTIDWTPDYVAWYLDKRPLRVETTCADEGKRRHVGELVSEYVAGGDLSLHDAEMFGCLDAISTFTEAMFLRFNLWPLNFNTFDAAEAWAGVYDSHIDGTDRTAGRRQDHSFSYVDWVRVYDYDTANRTFVKRWEDTFDDPELDANKWLVETHTFDINYADFARENVHLVQPGLGQSYLVFEVSPKCEASEDPPLPTVDSGRLDSVKMDVLPMSGSFRVSVDGEEGYETPLKVSMVNLTVMASSIPELSGAPSASVALRKPLTNSTIKDLCAQASGRWYDPSMVLGQLEHIVPLPWWGVRAGGFDPVFVVDVEDDGRRGNFKQCAEYCMASDVCQVFELHDPGYQNDQCTGYQYVDHLHSAPAIFRHAGLYCLNAGWLCKEGTCITKPPYSIPLWAWLVGATLAAFFLLPLISVCFKRLLYCWCTRRRAYGRGVGMCGGASRKRRRARHGRSTNPLTPAETGSPFPRQHAICVCGTPISTPSNYPSSPQPCIQDNIVGPTMAFTANRVSGSLRKTSPKDKDLFSTDLPMPEQQQQQQQQQQPPPPPPMPIPQPTPSQSQAAITTAPSMATLPTTTGSAMSSSASSIVTPTLTATPSPPPPPSLPVLEAPGPIPPAPTPPTLTIAPPAAPPSHAESMASSASSSSTGRSSSGSSEVGPPPFSARGGSGKTEAVCLSPRWDTDSTRSETSMGGGRGGGLQGNHGGGKGGRQTR
ncbi:unnamed protein product [Vitrella brassicaformis CCMP3155]|uniref:GH16 domain-containing protein n=2 Tax=Vitrella brassicaformis TaxID=1169539 RepID=A0A0G4GT18_VITBC|nr:unnamed protein product [Vitrella brassicaformis CCMP3155]|eukprot:CEM33550.1 unnamed protein product [Vitrella brassicaformis CCMP3155]